jgi:hypothetical protein
MKMKRLGLLHKTLASDHEAQGEHCVRVAGHFRTLAEAVAKAENSDAGARDTLEALASQFESQGNDHAERASHHSQLAEECAKSADDEIEKVLPLGSRVAPERPGIRAVLRPGQREDLEKKTVIPIEFQKLVQVEDDEF